MLFGNTEDGLFHIHRLPELNPYNVKYYVQVCAANLSVAKFYRQKNKVEKAVELLKENIYYLLNKNQRKMIDNPDELENIIERTKPLLVLIKSHYIP